MIDVNLPAFKRVVNKPFAGMMKNKSRVIFLWGGRGSGKSVAAVRYLIYRCLTEPHFKCILIRKVYDTIKESMWQAIKDEVIEMGLGELFEFTQSPMEIRCLNGAKFICRGLDKPEKLRSIKEPSFAWYEEGNQIDEDDWITVTTTLRNPKSRFLQEVFSFNPETNGEDYEDFWLYKKFFADHIEKTFDDSIDIEVNGKIEKFTYSSIWSTYNDNPHLPGVFKAMLESMKLDNPYYYRVFALGEWGNRGNDSPFYKTFTMANVETVEYKDWLPLHITFDENVNPYLTLTVHQVRTDPNTGKTKIWQLDEILLTHPKNTLRDTCAEFTRLYRNHKEGVFIYGDRTSNKADAKLEKGQNFFTLAREYLASFRPQMRIPNVNPNVKSRGEFINDVFAGRHEDLEIVIGDRCTTSINDYMNVVEAPDGTKHKQKIKDKKTGVSYEKHGHTSDANDYLHIEVFKTHYLSYINGNKKLDYVTGKRSSIRTRKNRM